MALSLELIDTFFCAVSKQRSYILRILFFFFSCNSTPPSGCSTLHGVKPSQKKWYLNREPFDPELMNFPTVPLSLYYPPVCS